MFDYHASDPNCFGKARLVGKRAANDLARQLVRRAALLGGKSRELSFLLQGDISKSNKSVQSRKKLLR
jgi:hypothetical protein